MLSHPNDTLAAIRQTAIVHVRTAHLQTAVGLYCKDPQALHTVRVDYVAGLVLLELLRFSSADYVRHLVRRRRLGAARVRYAWRVDDGA